MIESHRFCRWSVLAWAVLGGLLAGPGGAMADEPEGDIFAAVRRAVAERNVEKSRLLGFSITKSPFTEAAKEGYLVGFDCGVGKFLNGETVYAFRPVYRTPQGETWFKEYGIFADVRDGNKTIKTKVLRTVRLRARDGYAVGGATLRTGLNIDGLSLTYMRIVGDRLDPAQSYASDWVGDRKGGGEHKIEGTGNPVVGVFGNISDDRHVQALGFIYTRGLAKLPADVAKLPDVPAKPVVEATKPKAAPAEDPFWPPELRVKPPTAPAKPPVEPAPPQVVPEMKPEKRPWSATAQATTPSDAHLAGAIPFVAFGSVTITLVFVGLLFVRKNKGAAKYKPRASVPVRNEKVEPPAGPAPTVTLAESGAIRAADAPVRPLPAPAKLPAPPKVGPEIVRDAKPESKRQSTAGGMPLLELDDDPPSAPATPEVAPPAKLPTVPPKLPARAEEKDELPEPPKDMPVLQMRSKIHRCPHCGRALPQSELPQPWCAACGGDLRKRSSAMDAKPQAVDAKPQGTTTTPRLAFFTARMVTKGTQPLYRVYVLTDELLFLYAGPGTGNTAPGAGQALGGVVGAMIGQAVAAEMRERSKVRQLDLDKADVAKLRLFAQQDDNFRATAADFATMSIDAVGFWNSLSVGTDCAAVLNFTHRERGNFTLALLTLDDVRTATEELPATLGSLVKVNVVWSDASLKYVKKN